MPSNLTYRLTPKGRAEAGNGESQLGSTVRKLLQSAGTGATHEELAASMPEGMGERLRDLIRKLVSNGFLETVYADLTASDLDITRCFGRAAVEPTLIERREAERHTIAGMRALQESGYFVKIVNRAADEVAPQHGDRHAVLIIDGDESNAMLVARALMLAGFDTRSAATRDEIVTMLNRQPPVDVIAMDVALPDVIGLELLGRLCRHPVYREVPIIVMARAAGHDDVLAALAYGARGYLSKPVKADVMLESVKAVLGLR